MLHAEVPKYIDIFQVNGNVFAGRVDDRMSMTIGTIDLCGPWFFQAMTNVVDIVAVLIQFLWFPVKQDIGR